MKAAIPGGVVHANHNMCGRKYRHVACTLSPLRRASDIYRQYGARRIDKGSMLDIGGRRREDSMPLASDSATLKRGMARLPFLSIQAK